MLAKPLVAAPLMLQKAGTTASLEQRQQRRSSNTLAMAQVAGGGCAISYQSGNRRELPRKHLCDTPLAAVWELGARALYT